MFRNLPLLILLLLAMPAKADRVGLPTPSIWETCSPNGVYCARLDSTSNSVTVYRAGTSDQILWTMTGWSGVAALADDGIHLVLGYEGMSLIPVNYDPDMDMLTFFRRGEMIRRVTLSRLIRGGKLQRTISHWHWGDYLGLDEDGLYVVRTVDGREIRFDMTTGLPAR